MHDLRKIYLEYVAEMKAVDIPVQDEKIVEIKAGDMNRYLGLCNDDGYHNFTIVIRKDFLQDRCPFKELKEIVIHELIHTCPRCFSHGKTWKKYAQIMNDAYGYSLLEGKDDDSIFHKDKPILHRFVCPKCQICFDARAEGGSHRCPFCQSWYEEIS